MIADPPPTRIEAWNNCEVSVSLFNSITIWFQSVLLLAIERFEIDDWTELNGDDMTSYTHGSDKTINKVNTQQVRVIYQNK